MFLTVKDERNRVKKAKIELARADLKLCKVKDEHMELEKRVDEFEKTRVEQVEKAIVDN